MDSEPQGHDMTTYLLLFFWMVMSAHIVEGHQISSWESVCGHNFSHMFFWPLFDLGEVLYGLNFQ